MHLKVTALFVLAGIALAQNRAADGTAAQLNPAAAAPKSPAFPSCPAGAPIGAVDLRVQAGGQPLPFRTINHLSEGDTVLYSPVLRGKEKRPGEVSMVLVPEKRVAGQPDVIVTEPVDAGKPQQWKIDQTISIAALVYGPAGLSKKKVAQFLSKDEVLIAQLADYADKTAQAEQLVATLSNAESSSASVNAALNGFASQYGFAVQIDRNAPPAAQAQTVFAAMNPQLANYNPLASGTAQRVGQTASMATMAGSLFFGSPVGLAAGGTAMLLDLRAIAFPDTQFRTSFAQSLENSGVNLCGQQGAAPPHTRVAYIWANRIPNVAAPSIRIGSANYVPAAQKSPVPVDVPEAGWKYLDRVREWTLVGNDKQKTTVPVVKLASDKALELDLTKFKLPPGDYTLAGFWDWSPMKAAGSIHVLPLSDFEKAHIDPASQDRLLAGTGKSPASVTGSDFEFVTKVELQKLHDEFATPEEVRFLLPKGLRQGPQDHMDVQVPTQDRAPGDYALLISQQDGKKHSVKFKLLANPPKIDNLPLIVNQGAGAQHFVLKGERLDLITKLEVPNAVLDLDGAVPNPTERKVTVEWKGSSQPGTTLAINAYLQDRSRPLALSDALEIAPPLPVIASSKLSLPPGLAISVQSGEFPAGYTLNALLDVKNVDRRSILRLACADEPDKPVSLRIGEQTAHWNLQQLAPGRWFLAFDTSSLPAGCLFQAVVDNGRTGASQPFPLARILRTPQIESFTVSTESPQNGLRKYRLTGSNLELIQKLGWNDSSAVEITDLPVPLPGPGLKQAIEISLPDPPAPESQLWVWLRGDTQGRIASIKAPALPAPPPAPIAPPPPASDTEHPAPQDKPTGPPAPPAPPQEQLPQVIPVP